VKYWSFHEGQPLLFTHPSTVEAEAAFGKTKGLRLVFMETLKMEMFSMRKEALKILMAFLPAFLWIAAAPPKAGAG
jgi:hypothetical protein